LLKRGGLFGLAFPNPKNDYLGWSSVAPNASGRLGGFPERPEAIFAPDLFAGVSPLPFDEIYFYRLIPIVRLSEFYPDMDKGPLPEFSDSFSRLA
jgi:hypothetical protein